METNNTITATEAIRSFSDIINKVYYQHQTFDIKKGKSIVARIVPYNYSSKIEVKDLVNFFATSPKLEEGDADTFSNEINELRFKAKTRDITWD